MLILRRSIYLATVLLALGTFLSPISAVAAIDRLTLITGAPVMTADVASTGQVYYDCKNGKNVPYYTGSADANDTISSCEVSTVMQTSGTGVTNATGVFDVFWEGNTNHNICIVTNGSGGGWASDTGGSNTARGTGYSQVHNARGYLTNQNSVSHCYNTTTDYCSTPCAADKLTYLGTLYTTAAGRTTMTFAPTAAAGGTNNCICLWNAYNRVSVEALESDTNTNYTPPQSAWGTPNGSTSARVSWVDGLGQTATKSSVVGNMHIVSGDTAGLAVSLVDSTTIPAAPQAIANSGSSAASFPLTAMANSVPKIGFHFFQVLQIAFNASTSAGTNAGNSQVFSGDF